MKKQIKAHPDVEVNDLCWKNIVAGNRVQPWVKPLSLLFLLFFIIIFYYYFYHYYYYHFRSVSKGALYLIMCHNRSTGHVINFRSAPNRKNIVNATQVNTHIAHKACNKQANNIHMNERTHASTRRPCYLFDI